MEIKFFTVNLKRNLHPLFGMLAGGAQLCVVKYLRNWGLDEGIRQRAGQFRLLYNAAKLARIRVLTIYSQLSRALGEQKRTSPL